MQNKDIPVMILAGGRGTRLMEETRDIPKPMVTIGGKPILLHLMQYYSRFGFRKFIICLGYKGDVIKEYFLHVRERTATVRLHAGGRVEYESGIATDWDIILAETGEHSLTATRILRAADYVDAPLFALTYGDGLSDIDLNAELAFHRAHGKIGTMAAVHPPSRFGMMELAPDGKVRVFREKEKLHNDYINGGFFLLQKEFLARLPSQENVSLEAAPLTDLAAAGELYAYRHEGFWGCMDTMRDRENLEKIYESGSAPWAG
ncbi:MAG TPA: sugar phosphate nucleotidyltransferase [Kiritimatiellia bacterium]|jgi:glucose-1-phosphate cytidylyltransferase|nr:MAG: Glucose-1-phosphate cytidylyltransferase [Verrucomicrobia bacterium ADurb.Bin018]HOE00389.1 sugar phosphate nucleotidyltransferase [Kiritimatiellia bacterium]HOE37077.1 sugar phosphate nucleotidyltransferase [Kiritimatiellia bacterium]HOR74395.1 sugar phosphate nucleotidyltransferase [Kiritimatiellia bacterium]HOU59074.1 sugar phosphate nucleotidyltransferase [Kiritimatiellia bacterium]